MCSCLQDDVEDSTEDAAALYTRFKITATDIAVFLADGAFSWEEYLSGSKLTDGIFSGGRSRRWSLLQRCGVSAVLQQVRRCLPAWQPSSARCCSCIV